MEPEEDEDGGGAANLVEDTASEIEEVGVSLHAALKPATAGLSFALTTSGTEMRPTLRIKVASAAYRRFAVDDAGKEVEGTPPDRSHERWRRIPLNASFEIELHSGEARKDLAEHGIAGLELYVLVTPHGGVETVTLAPREQAYPWRVVRFRRRAALFPGRSSG